MRLQDKNQIDNDRLIHYPKNQKCLCFGCRVKRNLDQNKCEYYFDPKIFPQKVFDKFEEKGLSWYVCDGIQTHGNHCRSHHIYYNHHWCKCLDCENYRKAKVEQFKEAEYFDQLIIDQSEEIDDDLPF